MNDGLINMLTFFLFFLFLVSSIPKIINIKHFINLVIQYEVLPKRLSIIYGAILPFAELSSSILLLSDEYFLIGILSLGFILVTFYIAVSKTIKMKKKISCGCHGRFLDTKVDMFTLGKLKALIIIVGIVLSVSLLKPFSVEFSMITTLSGAYIAVVLMMFQKVWDIHKDAIDTLQNIEERV